MSVIAGGCQTGKPVTNRQLIQHQAMIDFSGLKPVEEIPDVRMSCAVPRQWEAMPLRKTPMYVHQQWRSPSGTSGVGVAYIRLPLPLSERTVIWLAKQEYTKRANDGRVINQWTDAVGRSWFEAENKYYHVRGYVIVRGFNAWFAYFGSKASSPPDMGELSLAARCVETFVPDPAPMPKPAPDLTASAQP
jgi:hypothetical protein